MGFRGVVGWVFWTFSSLAYFVISLILKKSLRCSRCAKSITDLYHCISFRPNVNQLVCEYVFGWALPASLGHTSRPETTCYPVLHSPSRGWCDQADRRYQCPSRTGVQGNFSLFFPTLWSLIFITWHRWVVLSIPTHIFFIKKKLR